MKKGILMAGATTALVYGLAADDAKISASKEYMDWLASLYAER